VDITSGTHFLLSDRKLFNGFIRSVLVPTASTDLRALLYISDTLAQPRTAMFDAEAIVEVSRRNNAVRHITGALMVTERHFVQFLEGPATALDRLLATLYSDKRHQNLRILNDGPARLRRFAHWSLAYCGPQSFVAAYLEKALRADVRGARARGDLVEMMVAFAGAALPEGSGDDASRD
jgi:hypothetical protein